VKVLIPTAGIGSRLGELTDTYNKTMIPIGKRPVISHIIDAYPASAEFVIALGYKGDQIRQFLTMAYPDRKIDFIEIDNFDGPGSGPGYTLRQCKSFIDGPFLFHANDSIIVDVDLKYDFKSDTILLAADNPDSMNYRTASVDTEHHRVARIHDKTVEDIGEIFNYIGVAYVHDYERFLDGLDDLSVEIGESEYFMDAVERGVDYRFVDQWFDIGSLEQLRITRKAISDFDNLPKSDETLYFVNDSVFKYFENPTLVEQRVSRAEDLINLVPQITAVDRNFYAYNYVPGTLMSEKLSLAAEFKKLLNWSEANLWRRFDLGPQDQSEFKDACFAFYYDKTVERVNQFYERFDHVDSEQLINGTVVPSVDELLGGVDWSEVRQGIAANFHGDYHFENIIQTDSGYSLIDWRQSFGSISAYGDIYYDLAKLYHGLLVNHEIIKSDLYTVEVASNGDVDFDYFRRDALIACESILETFVRENGFSWARVKLLTSLIFLNISALHHYPYSHLLFFLGKSMLYETVKENGTI
jgi:choline kinase/thiamine kinase-like enzyme